MAEYDLGKVVGEKGDTGDTGATGATGNGIQSITLQSTVGKVKTYRITYTNGNTFDYQVRDGEDGSGATVEIVTSWNTTTSDEKIPSEKLTKTSLDGKAPTSHATSATTYGLGTTSNYGHVKTINALTQSSHSNGTALSAYQGYLLNNAISSKADASSIPTKTSDLSNDSNFISTSSTSGLIKNDGTIDTTTYSTFSGSYADLSNKPSIPSSSSDLSDGSSLVKTSSTTGLLKNDGTIDTTTYLSSLPSHNHDDRYYTESEVDTALNGKQATLVSGTNIKTINNNSILGTGNINIESDNFTILKDKCSSNDGLVNYSQDSVYFKTTLYQVTTEATNTFTYDSTNNYYVLHPNFGGFYFSAREVLPLQGISDATLRVKFKLTATTWKQNNQLFICCTDINTTTNPSAKPYSVRVRADNLLQYLDFKNTETTLYTHNDGFVDDWYYLEVVKKGTDWTINLYDNGLILLHTETMSSLGTMSGTPKWYIGTYCESGSDVLIKEVKADYDIETVLANKQDLLVSGTNIKTIINNSLLGSGNIAITTDDITDSSAYSTIGTSANATQKQINNAINTKIGAIMTALGNCENLLGGS